MQPSDARVPESPELSFGIVCDVRDPGEHEAAQRLNLKEAVESVSMSELRCAHFLNNFKKCKESRCV